MWYKETKGGSQTFYSISYQSFFSLIKMGVESDGLNYFSSLSAPRFCPSMVSDLPIEFNLIVSYFIFKKGTPIKRRAKKTVPYLTI